MGMNDSEEGSPNQHLVSEYVFIDSEAYVRCGFDFSGSVLASLLSLLRQECREFSSLMLPVAKCFGR
jgi:hypothetical protein